MRVCWFLSSLAIAIAFLRFSFSMSSSAARRIASPCLRFSSMAASRRCRWISISLSMAAVCARSPSLRFCARSSSVLACFFSNWILHRSRLLSSASSLAFSDAPALLS